MNMLNNLKCKLGFHDYSGCTCRNCGKLGTEGHDWSTNCERCSRCSATRKDMHDWSKDCEQCLRCGASRKDTHDWQKGICIKCGKNIDEKNSVGFTRLALAAMKGNVILVNNLLDGGANPNVIKIEDMRRMAGKVKRESDSNLCIDDMIPLIGAAQNGYLEVVKILLSAGSNIHAKTNVGNTALMLAALKGHLDIVKVLINAGANVNALDIDGNPILLAAVNSKSFPIAKLLIEKGSKDNKGLALYNAAGKGHFELVKLLIDGGSDINALDKNGGPVLFAAVNSKNTSVIKLLLDNGAKDNECIALVQAGGLGLDEIVKLIAAKRPYLKGAAKYGIVCFATRGSREMVELFLNLGADINIKDDRDHNLTPLHCAAAYGHLELVKFLVEKGADITAKDAFGYTALGLAEKRNCNETVAYLRKITKTESFKGKPNIKYLAKNGIAGKKLEQMQLEPLTKYRVQISFSLRYQMYLSAFNVNVNEQIAKFETDKNTSIINISPKFNNKMMIDLDAGVSTNEILFNCSIIAIEDITHGITAGVFTV